MGNAESSGGNGGLSALNMCCNNAYVSKNHELLAPEYNNGQRVKMQERRQL